MQPVFDGVNGDSCGGNRGRIGALGALVLSKSSSTGRVWGKQASPTSTGVTDDLGILRTGRNKKNGKPRSPSRPERPGRPGYSRLRDTHHTRRYPREDLSSQEAFSCYFPRRRRITPPSPSRPDPSSIKLAGSGVLPSPDTPVTPPLYQAIEPRPGAIVGEICCKSNQ